jgi:hypothetical protein
MGESARRTAAGARLPRMKACDSSGASFCWGRRPKQREVYLPEHRSDDQIIEIPCVRCHTTTPRTIAWIRANDRYNCPGCNAPIIVARNALLAAAGLEPTE